MNKQRAFDIDPQPSLFTVEERDQLEDIAEQASTEDRKATSELVRWAKS